jgi:tetratricopeptide (TPR) repeat protein
MPSDAAIPSVGPAPDGSLPSARIFTGAPAGASSSDDGKGEALQLFASARNAEREGKLEVAEADYRKALAGFEAVLGPAGGAEGAPAVDTDTMRTQNCLASLLKRQGRYEEAAPLLRSALIGGQAALGPAHPSTLGTMQNLALLLSEVGALEEANGLYRGSLEGYEHALAAAPVGSPQHTQIQGYVMSTVCNLANLLAEQGRFEEAEPLYRRALDGFERSLGAMHPSTLSTLNGLAILLAEQGHHEEAIELFRRALDGYEGLLGAEHPASIDTTNNLANVLADAGKPDEASPLFERALKAKEAALGKDHPSTLGTAHGYALLLKEQGRERDMEEILRTYSMAFTSEEDLQTPGLAAEP